MATPAQAVPLIPETAPFTPEQRAWLNGFVAGILARAQAPAQAAAPQQALRPLTILFGSQTGTAEALAKRAAKAAVQRGFAASVVDMAQTAPGRLAQEQNVLLITSTYGDGEPPDNAKALHAALCGAGGPSLSGVRFSVCGLGDTNYTRFCQSAKDFDAAIERLGGRRVAPRADCDLDYEKPFGDWIDAALAGLGPGPAPAARAEAPAPEVGHSRRNPFAAAVVVSRRLSGEGSAKQVQHVEVDLGSSGMAYEAGDALGVWPQNCPELVNELLGRLGCDGEEAVLLPDGAQASLRRALTERCDLGKPTAELASRFSAPNEASPAAGGAPLHVMDLVASRPETRLAPAELVRMLRPLAPRLYSISSSPSAHPGSVHVTVAAVRYEAHGRGRKGVCSTFLADRVTAGAARAGVFIHPNPAFRLPASGDAPVIMVGPGTGVAPFRGFLHERRARGAKGRAWLFFGDQHEATDFLYADELAELRRDGTLTRLDTAFSRDQEAKVYVQHRMLENAGELFSWLEAGAHVYVCGDASRMAKDVDAALAQIVSEQGGRGPEKAQEYLQALRAARRYCRDVY
ncbi:MAG TPA: sulfite reductase subunit alpha [Opitutaceae bacterium]|jgi:sulfite reductase (NADPH) flavoprotein alpha-component